MKQISYLLYIFVLISCNVQAQTFELPADVPAYDYAGWRVDIEGNTAVLGVLYGQTDFVNTGLVLVYEYTEGAWQFKQELRSNDIMPRDMFGGTLKIHNQRIFISSIGDNQFVEGIEVVDSGSVYVFERINESWTQTAKIAPEIIEEDDAFGITLAATKDRLFVAKGDLDDVFENGASVGSVHVFDLVDDAWIESAVIESDYSNGILTTLGYWEMSASGQSLAVSQVYSTETMTSGVINIYVNNNGEWQLRDVIQSPNEGQSDFYGRSVDLKGNRLLVSAPYEESADGSVSEGAVYLYEYNGSTWDMVNQFTPPNSDGEGSFGFDAVLGNNQVFIARPFQLNAEEEIMPGEVFVYDQAGDSWALTNTFTESNITERNDFGRSIAFDQQRLLVGVPYAYDRVGTALGYAIEPNAERLAINAGLNGAWFNPDTSGQGIFLDVNQTADFSFMGLFTYDTELVDDDSVGQIGATGQRWLVAGGDIDEANSLISFDLYYAYDGLFDDSSMVSVSDTTAYGWLIMDFQDCSNAIVSYGINDAGLAGTFPVIRPAPDSGDLCGELSAAVPSATDDEYDYSLNGGWFNPATPGQGIFIDKFKGLDAAFMGWFTYDSSPIVNPISSAIGADGQRWLVGTGAVDPDNAKVINYQLYYTYGGLFNDPTAVTVIEPGTYGTMRIEFIDCGNAQVEYEIDSEGLSGSFAMVRSIPDTSNCQVAGF